MILYHGSNQPIADIDLSQGKKFKDFGQGFYTTHIKEQAVYWSRRIAERFGGTPTVTKFEFDLASSRPMFCSRIIHSTTRAVMYSTRKSKLLFNCFISVLCI